MTHFTKIFSAVFLFMIAVTTIGTAQETTWASPPISTQLEMDDTLIPFGK